MCSRSTKSFLRLVEIGVEASAVGRMLEPELLQGLRIVQCLTEEFQATSRSGRGEQTLLVGRPEGSECGKVI